MNFSGNPYANISGFKVVYDRSFSDRVQVRFPKTKKKRIRRKWAKNPKYYADIPRMDIFKVGGTLIGHPAAFEELCKASIPTTPAFPANVFLQGIF